jgi:phosphoglycerol transferase MdoB-like AlkP superfamily enzyme
MMLESNASHKTGIFGNPLNPSPNFDKLAEGGAYFSRFYAPHIGTARAVFASFFGLPDIEVNQTSSRNPLIVDQHTLFNAFQDYEKYYFLGGSASWANIRAMLKHNIPRLQIYEEGSYSANRVDVWGISDLHMLEEANEVFAGLDGQPFAAFVHLSGNHPPYNIPEDNRGFEHQNISDDEVSKYGFSSAKEYNSYRFMDHSLGVFFERAKKEAYFENTMFVLYGDNGAPNSSEHQAAGERELELTRYQTPLVIYSPGIIEPKVIDTVASTVDVLPTIAGLLGLDCVNKTIGRDLFDARFDDSRYALTLTRQGPGHLLGLIGEDYYFLIASDGDGPRLHRIYANRPSENLIEELPDVADQYQMRLFAIYETVKFMRYHNQ